MDTPLERFLRYVKIDTQSNELSKTSPSTAKQLILSRLLEAECKQLGLQDISCSENGVVMATIPPTVEHGAPTSVWNAHIDTSPECSGADVRPIIHTDYPGGDIVLSCNPPKPIRMEENPSRSTFRGADLTAAIGTA